MRPAADDRQRVGNEQRAQPAGSLVGIDDRHRHALLDLAPARRRCRSGRRPARPPPTAIATCLLPERILHVVGLELAEELLGALGRPRRRTGRRHAWPWCRTAAWPSPPGRATSDRPGRGSKSGGPASLYELGVDQQHPGPGGEAVPVAFGDRGRRPDNRRRSAAGRPPAGPAASAAACAGSRCSRTRRSAAGPFRPRWPRPARRSWSIRCRTSAGTAMPAGRGEIAEDRLGEFGVQGRIDDNLRPGRPTSSRQQRHNSKTDRCDAPAMHATVFRAIAVWPRSGYTCRSHGPYGGPRTVRKVLALTCVSRL